MAQTKNSRRVVGGAAFAATIACCIPLTSKWEGVWLTAKPDRLAHGIPTVCYGETEGVKLGDHYTKAQCEEMLSHKLPRYLMEIDRCIHVPVSNRTRAAFLDASYNIGSGGICKSTAMRLLNAGQDHKACEALRPFNHSAGQYRQGLANRREDEISNYCLKGLSEEKFMIVNGENAPAVINTAEQHNPVIKSEPKPVLPPKCTFWQKLTAWWSK